MTEIGVVVKTDNKGATVKINKRSECEKCGMCLFPKNAGFVEIQCTNSISAKVDDNVVIERDNDGKALGVFLVFVVPLLLIAIFLIVGYVCFKSETVALISSMASFLVWLVVLALIDKKIKNKQSFCWQITKVLTDKKD